MSVSRPRRRYRREIVDWFPPGAQAAVDVGCNVGELLTVMEHVPGLAYVAGAEISREAVALARLRAPGVDVRQCSADALPFADATFDVVTCIDALEHFPERIRADSLREMHRVSRPGAVLILQVPHAGKFAVLDPQNFRHRLPRLYDVLIGSGVRDENYLGMQKIVWHHHFTIDEIQALVSPWWTISHVSRPACLVAPVMDTLRWPFLRARRLQSKLVRTMMRAIALDCSYDWGSWGYELFLVAERASPAAQGPGSLVAS